MMFSAHGITVPETMRSMIYDANGPGKMAWHGLEKVPVPGNNKVLIKVEAASLNPADLKITDTQTSFMPHKGEPVGRDFAGTIAALGKNVRGFTVGEKVFGLAPGCAQYTVADPHRIVQIPLNGNVLDYGVIGYTGVVAHQILAESWFDRPNYTARTILVIGASGGVGSMVVQIARAFGGPELTIYGVCSHKNGEFAKEMGCSQSIDYATPGFDISRALPARSVDIIVDVVSGRPYGPNYVDKAFTLLKPSGRYIALNSQSSIDWIRSYMTDTCGCNVQRARYDLFSVNQKRPARSLQSIARLMNDGKLRPHVSHEIPLAETPLRRALHTVKQGHTRGKIRVVPEQHPVYV